MVKVKSSFGKVSGTSANTIYYEVNGVTFGRSKPAKMGNPKTEAQMKQRIKMNNILNTYKYIKGYLQQNFEGIIGNKNASSFFRSYNLMKTPVWLTKDRRSRIKFNACSLCGGSRTYSFGWVYVLGGWFVRF